MFAEHVSSWITIGARDASVSHTRRGGPRAGLEGGLPPALSSSLNSKVQGSVTGHPPFSPFSALSFGDR